MTGAELSFVLAQVVCGRLLERGLVALVEPSGEESLRWGDVAGGALADPGIVGQKGGQQIIRRKGGALWNGDRAWLRRAAGQRSSAHVG